ncbi:MAG: hypothetical protein ABW220_09980 [Burkholderiaceae bacterium]
MRGVSTVLSSVLPGGPERRTGFGCPTTGRMVFHAGTNKRRGDAGSLLDGSTGIRLLGLDPKIVN